MFQHFSLAHFGVLFGCEHVYFGVTAYTYDEPLGLMARVFSGPHPADALIRFCILIWHTTAVYLLPWYTVMSTSSRPSHSASKSGCFFFNCSDQHPTNRNELGECVCIVCIVCIRRANASLLIMVMAWTGDITSAAVATDER